MADQSNNKAKGLDSYQPVEKTYSPRVINGNYQPIIPTAVASQQPTPPIGDSGVPAARSSSAAAPAPWSAKALPPTK